MTSTLIFGARDAVLVGALETVPEATALADWVSLHDRRLTTIYITHGRGDHFLGLPVLLDRLPGARPTATGAWSAGCPARSPSTALAVCGLATLLPGAHARQLASVDVPVLAAAAEHDSFGPAGELAGYLPASPDVEVQVLPRAYHNSNVAPERQTVVGQARPAGREQCRVLQPRGSTVRGDGWSPARPWDEAERVTGRVSVDIFSVESPCPEGQYGRLERGHVLDHDFQVEQLTHGGIRRRPPSRRFGR